MSNSFFNNTIDLVGGTKARASDVEGNFTAVSTGFDGVETALNLKAPLVSPALTGTPTAPTAAPGTASTQIATTQFVANAALTAVLPGQSGNNGKFLTTDGSNATWAALSIAWGSVTGKPTTLTGYGITMSAARTELGATAVGESLFMAASAAAARTAVGATTTGSNVLTAVDQPAARTAIGGGTIGQDVFIATTQAAARTAIGALAAGDNIGAATATTQSAGTANTTVATTAFVDTLRDVAANSQAASYTLALTDRGKSIDFTGSTGQTITIPANASVAFPVGSVITITNTTANNLSIAITTDTLRQGGTANTGTRTLGQYGVATVRKVASTLWIIGGSGLT